MLYTSWLFCSVRSTPVLPQWHVRDPGHSAKSASGRLNLNTHTPFTQQNRSGLTMPLSRHSVGTDQETSSHATRQGKLGHSCLSSLSHCGLILAEKRNWYVRTDLHIKNNNNNNNNNKRIRGNSIHQQIRSSLTRVLFKNGSC